MNRRFVLVFVGQLAAAGICAADVVHLKNGRDVEGEIRKTPDGWMVISDGKVTQVTAADVASIEVKPVVTADTAMSRLQSLRHATEKMSDLQQIIERYQTFINQNYDTPAATEARADLQAWRDRLSQGLVKVGDKWVTAAERDTARAQLTQSAIAIHDLVKANRIKEAVQQIDRSLSIDPQNVSLLYLKGVVQFQQDQLAQSRKSFEQVSATLTEHPPTLNNLAVITWRQNTFGVSLAFYDRAMQAAPGSRDILDNVSEAINSMTPEVRKLPLAQKVMRRFQEQDDDLQKRMKEKGLFRWGSKWVDEKQKATLEEQEKKIKDELAKLQVDYDDNQARLNACDRRMGELQQMMQTLWNSSMVPTNDGRIVQMGLPQSYFDYSREYDRLKLDHASFAAALDRIRAQGKQVQQKMPSPKYTGTQKLIDADGMPLPMPTTQPGAR